MAKKAVEFKVGIVVIIGVILLLASIFWLQGYRFRSGSYELKVRFNDVGGLKSGDRVMVSGVNKGKVMNVNLAEQGVVATINLDGDTYLYDDAEFIVKNYGLMGERYISISRGESQTKIDPEKMYFGTSDAGTAELMGLLGEMVKDVQGMIKSFRKTIASDQSLENLSSLVGSLGELTEELNSFMSTNKSLINTTMTNVEQVSNRLITFVDTTENGVKTTLNNFSEASQKLNSLTDSLTLIASSLSSFLEDFEQGKGTLGLLGTDETLYQDVKRMLRSVETIIEDIRRDPERFLNIEMKLF